MKNWTLDNINIGMFVIPEGYNVFGNPHQCLPVMEQVIVPESGRFGLMNIPSGHMEHRFERAFRLVDHLNYHDMRLLTRKELAFLILYMDKDFFALPPEDQPIDNGQEI